MVKKQIDYSLVMWVFNERKWVFMLCRSNDMNNNWIPLSCIPCMSLILFVNLVVGIGTWVAHSSHLWQHKWSMYHIFFFIVVNCLCIIQIKATSHTRLKAHDHDNVRAYIGGKNGDHPSSFHTRRWIPKGPTKSSWMKSVHGVLHARICIRLHGLPKFTSGPPPRGGYDANFGRPWHWNICQWLAWLF